ncbi:MAG: ABC transporter permease [Acidobacteriia bacterium]|nr:ABC transporter permease [Terriglobia bacterium]
MAPLIQDIRYALRVLLKSPGFSFAAVAVLALGIGANSAIFSVVNTVLLRPLPFPAADRLVQIYHVPPARAFPGMKRFSVSPGNYLDWRAQGKSFDGMAAYGPRQFTLTGLDRPETIRATMAGGDFFAILGAQPVLGRLFDNSDDQPGRGNVAVISASFWQSHFASNPGALDRTLILEGQPYSIIGVAPKNLHFPAWMPTASDIWIPLAWSDKTRAIRKDHNYLVMARMRPGVSIQQAQAEMNTISNRLQELDPDANRDWGAIVYRLSDDLVGNIRPVLLVLLGAVAFVLLIACANVANLVTARNLARKKEIAIRAALGASRGRALQQLLCETLLLSIAGGAVGLAIAAAAMPLLVRFVSQQFDVGDEIPLDAPVLLFTAAIAILTGLLAGAVPAWRGSKSDLNDALKQGSRGGSDTGTRRTRSALVAAEVALSLMLLAGAGLMIRSLWILTGVNPGFDPKNVLTMTVPVSPTDPAQVAAAYDRVLERVRALPGVESAGVIGGLPLRGGSNQPFTIEGKPALPFAQQPNVAVRSISPGYLRAMRIPVLRGRDLNDSDAADRPHAVLISESMAKRFWPGENPIGQHLRLSFSPEEPREVVGIVGDVKQDGLDTDPSSSLYQAEKQQSLGQLSLVVRTTVKPETLISPITATLQQLDPTKPLRNVRTMQSIVEESIADRRLSMFMLAAFSGLALILAAFGLYSVLAYTVRRRFREIGIRMALGAGEADVLRIVALESFRPTAAGIVIGLVGSYLLSTLLAKLVYGISPNDPATFAAVALVLAFVAILASVIPAWRATRVDPLQVLRDE